MAEHTKICELPASERVTRDSLSNKVVVGRAFSYLISVTVSLLMKIISPFQAV